MRDAVRVALLARPGAGGDRLREALRAAGAELVLDADPTNLDPATFANARAESVVVLLDSAVEDALDRLDPVLHDPAIDVLYEESEVAAAREGWDVARWTRHLSAKLLRHGDVLPPGREADAGPATRAAPPAASPAADPMPSLADEHALAPPATPAPAPPAPPAPPAAPPSASMFDPVSAEYEPVAHDPVDAEPAAARGAEIEPLDFEPLAFTPPAPDPTGEAGAVGGPQGEIPPLDMPPLDMPPVDTPPVGAPSDKAPPTSYDGPLTLSLEGDDDAPRGGATHPAGPATPSGAAPHAPSGPRSDALRDFRRDLASIEQRIASMDLVDAEPRAADAPDAATPSPDEPAPAAPDPSPAPPAPAGPVAGAVLVFAGIGGPDAVRQFLGALPEGFPRPVLIHQRLDGGRHDRLVQQMARATSLPVQLAADGEPVAGGHVYILPPGLGLDDGANGLRFVEGGDPMATLPPAESAVLMFSGSDTALVEAAMGHARAGALVAGQSPEDCYDAAASDALVAQGAESGPPADLARRLADRWAA